MARKSGKQQVFYLFVESIQGLRLRVVALSVQRGRHKTIAEASEIQRKGNRNSMGPSPVGSVPTSLWEVA